MAKRELLWILIIVTLSSIKFPSTLRSCKDPFLKLSLSPSSRPEQQYTLTLRKTGESLHYEFRDHSGMLESGIIPEAESKELLSGFGDTHALGDRPSGGLYPEFIGVLQIDGQTSRFHGFTEAHLPVLQALILSPSLRSGMERGFKWCGSYSPPAINFGPRP